MALLEAKIPSKPHRPSKNGPVHGAESNLGGGPRPTRPDADVACRSRSLAHATQGLLASLAVALLWLLVPGDVMAQSPEPVMTGADPEQWGMPADAVEDVTRRTRDSKNFVLPDGRNVAVFERQLHYQPEPGVWDEVDLNFQTDGTDKVVRRHALQSRSTSKGIEISDSRTGKGVRWLILAGTRTEGRRVSFASRGLEWQYVTTKTGLKLEATVTAPRGWAWHGFRYEMVGGAEDFTIDPDGNAVSDGFRIPRAIVLGADGVIYETGPWHRLRDSILAFTFDDGPLPAAAYPYVIDPNTQFDVAISEDDGTVRRTGGYPPVGNPDVYVSATTIYTQRSDSDAITARVGNALIRWDTSYLPNDALVEDVTLRAYVTSLHNANGRNLTADWYTAWPIDGTDYQFSRQSSALSGIPISSITSGQDNDWSLDNGAANVSLTGFTGVRLHVDGAYPTGLNNVHIASNDHTSQSGPRLIVTYSVPNPDDYAFIIEVAATNDGSSAWLGPLPNVTNTSNLVSGGYVDNSGAQTLFTDSANAKIPGFAQDMANATSTWWWFAEIGAGQSTTLRVFTNGSSTAHAFPLGGGTDRIEVADDASLDITDELTVKVTAKLEQIPTGETLLVDKSSAFELGVRGSNEVFARVYTSSTSTSTVAFSPIAPDTEYNFKLTFSNPDLRLYVNGALESATTTASTLATSADAVIIGKGIIGGITDVDIGHTDLDSPSWALQMGFDPALIGETQAGNAGNGWEWRGTVQDLSEEQNDGTYYLTADITDLTVQTSGLIVVADLATTTDRTIASRVPTLPLAVLTEVQKDNLIASPFLDPIRGLVNQGTLPRHAFWLILTTVIASGASARAYRMFPSLMAAAVAGGLVYFCSALIFGIELAVVALLGCAFFASTVIYNHMRS